MEAYTIEQFQKHKIIVDEIQQDVRLLNADNAALIQCESRTRSEEVSILAKLEEYVRERNFVERNNNGASCVLFCVSSK